MVPVDELKQPELNGAPESVPKIFDRVSETSKMVSDNHSSAVYPIGGFPQGKKLKRFPEDERMLILIFDIKYSGSNQVATKGNKWSHIGCEKTFTRNSNAQRHWKFHRDGNTDQKTEGCLFCEKQFVRKDLQDLHLKSMHGERRADK